MDTAQVGLHSGFLDFIGYTVELFHWIHCNLQFHTGISSKVIIQGIYSEMILELHDSWNLNLQKELHKF